jgi:hypothetical protein
MRPTELLGFVQRLFLLRAHPSEFPPSTLLLVQVFALDVAVGSAYRAVTGNDGNLLISLGLNGISLGLLFLLLNAFGQAARFVQTAGAMTALSVCVTLAMLPVSAALNSSAEDAADLVTQILSLALISVVLWNLVIYAHILRHALNLGWWGGAMATLALIFANDWVTHLLFPELRP